MKAREKPVRKDGLFACQKSIFDTFIENLRIFDEQEEAFGLLKISRFSGCNPDQRYYFSAAFALEKSNPPHMSPDLIFQAGLRQFLTVRARPLVRAFCLLRIALSTQHGLLEKQTGLPPRQAAIFLIDFSEGGLGETLFF